MLIPERTLECWIALEIAKAIKSATIWCPTQPRQALPVGQAATDPWDMIAGARHLFALEVKGLEEPKGRGSPTVTVDCAQLELLRMHRVPLHNLVRYALPAPIVDLPLSLSPHDAVVPSAATFQRGTSLFTRVLTLDDADRLVRGRTSGTSRHHVEEVNGHGKDLGAFLAAVDECTDTATGSDARELLANVHPAEAGLLTRLVWVRVD